MRCMKCGKQIDGLECRCGFLMTEFSVCLVNAYKEQEFSEISSYIAGKIRQRNLKKYLSNDTFKNELIIKVKECDAQVRKIMHGRFEYEYQFYDNGDHYRGEWVNDKKEGKGIYQYFNGDVLTAIFMRGNIKRV